jgi:hypothetical protein
MTIPSYRIAEFLHPGTTMISVRTSSGFACCEIDRMQLDAMIGDNSIIGITRGKRLLYVQLIVPPGVAFRALGESRGGDAVGSNPTYREGFSGAAPITSLKKYHAPTGAYIRWGPGERFPKTRSAVAAHPKRAACALRPPVRSS